MYDLWVRTWDSSEGQALDIHRTDLVGYEDGAGGFSPCVLSRFPLSKQRSALAGSSTQRPKNNYWSTHLTWMTVLPQSGCAHDQRATKWMRCNSSGEEPQAFLISIILCVYFFSWPSHHRNHQTIRIIFTASTTVIRKTTDILIYIFKSNLGSLQLRL